MRQIVKLLVKPKCQNEFCYQLYSTEEPQSYGAPGVLYAKDPTNSTGTHIRQSMNQSLFGRTEYFRNNACERP